MLISQKSGSMKNRKRASFGSLYLYLLVLFTSLLPTFAYANATSLAQRGLVVAKVRCAPCHFLMRKQRRIGPGLFGVFNREPSISGVPFKVWNEVSLERWLTNPRAVKINTPMYMSPLSARDRALVIAWLKQNHL